MTEVKAVPDNRLADSQLDFLQTFSLGDSTCISDAFGENMSLIMDLWGLSWFTAICFLPVGLGLNSSHPC